MLSYRHTANNYRVIFLTGPPKIWLSPRSHVNWPRISLSTRGYKGILYLENLGGTSQKYHPVPFQGWYSAVAQEIWFSGRSKTIKKRMRQSWLILNTLWYSLVKRYQDIYAYRQIQLLKKDGCHGEQRLSRRWWKPWLIFMISSAESLFLYLSTW